jgi:hypothetical protein
MIKGFARRKRRMEMDFENVREGTRFQYQGRLYEVRQIRDIDGTPTAECSGVNPNTNKPGRGRPKHVTSQQIEEYAIAVQPVAKDQVQAEPVIAEDEEDGAEMDAMEDLSNDDDLDLDDPVDADLDDSTDELEELDLAS